MNYANAPIIISFLIGIILLSLLIFFTRANASKEKITEDFLEQLRAATGEEIETKKENTLLDTGLLSKWNNYWGDKMRYARIIEPEMPNSKVGLLLIVIGLVVYGLFSLFFKNVGIGLIPVAVFYGGVTGYVNKKVAAKEKLFEDQIPPFISILKSNLQAGETPEHALINAINETDNPLYDELKIAKSLTETGSFQKAISTLRETTSNETLKFLSSCIELSAKVGSDLQEQIVIIEEVLENRSRLKRKLAVAVAENKPLLYLSYVLVPGIFLFTYFNSDQARDFWFTDLISWVVFFVLCFIFLGGTYLTSRIIKNTDKF